MFGKIKGKLGDIFKKNEEVIEENTTEDVKEQSEVTLDKTSDDVAQVKVEETESIPELPVLEEDSSDEEEKEEKPGLVTIEDSSEHVESKSSTSFLGRLFGKKKEEEEEIEVEEVEEALLENVDEKEKEAIKNQKDLPEEVVEENKEHLEEQIQEEEKLEEDTVEDIKDSHTNVEEELEKESKKEKKEELPQEEKLSEEIEEPNFEEETIDETIEKEEDTVEEIPEDEKVSEKVLEKVQEEEGTGLISKFTSKLKKKEIVEDDFDKIWVELEIFLLEINIAFEIVEKIERKLRNALIGNSFSRFSMSEKIREIMISEVEDVLVSREADFLAEIKEYQVKGELLKIMMLGVNGTGKTTSIAKIIHFLKQHDFKFVVAASDTFRAAAVDQLAEHCKNLDVKLIQHKDGSDPAAVAYDAVEHAKAKELDIVLIDTAGRMPNNSNLMMELQKVKRVSQSQMAMFVGDSIAGNDLIDQINLFDKGVEINGVMLTKVDTDERPGSVVTTAYSINKPIYFLGIGQDYEDLVVFNAREVAEKLFDIESDDDSSDEE